MPQTDRDSTPQHARVAYRRGIANGILFATGMAFIDPITVLPTFVSRLTDSEVAVGLISGLGMSGWFLPQLFAANYLQSRPYKRPLYIFAAFLRGVGLLLIIPLIYFLARGNPAAALVAFFLGYALYSFSGGLSGPAFLDIVAKTIPSGRLGAFFGHRQFWGGLGAIGCGILVRFILSADALIFPTGYCLLFGLALASFVPGWTAFATIPEPRGKVEEAQPLIPFLRSAPTVIREHREFRLLLASRLLTGCAGIALPFYIIYCRQVVGVPEAAVGIYLSIQMAGSVALIPLWAFLNDRRGPRTLLVAVAALTLAVPSVALLAAFFPDALGFGRVVFGAVFFPLAAIAGGGFMGYTNYLFRIAPEQRRPLYIGVQNTLFALTAFLPLLGGLVVGLTSFRFLFLVAAAMGALGLIATIILPSNTASGRG
ncbi:MAG: MFS transporter [Armatimonadota bacterium]|nr:MAG: MFS transporter [Armatimonadota bacterium]